MLIKASETRSYIVGYFQEEEAGVFQFSISISPKNLSCIVDANDLLPAICEIAVQATNTTDMQVEWVNLENFYAIFNVFFFNCTV